ncbi:hypothetical protein ACUSIJ_23220 [Pseudochelatococcus sp. B33]
MLIAKAEKARAGRSRKVSHGVGFWYSSFMGLARHDIKPGLKLPEPGSLSPAVFLVEQDSDTEIQPHFHIADQFQVFIHGSGWIGKHEARDLSVYYTSAYTPYGPLRSGPEGLSFFTFRDSIDFGARYMPQSREELRGVERKARFAYAGPVDRPSLAECESAGCAVATLLAAEDGLGAWLHTMPEGETVAGPRPSSGGGQFWLSLGGQGTAGDRLLAANDCLFVAPDEPAATVVAGAGGTQVLVVQFPLRASLGTTDRPSQQAKQL